MTEERKRITRVYTKTGDKGETGLSDGSRLPKNHIRIESYGTLDELNSVLGVCIQSIPTIVGRTTETQFIFNLLTAIQNDLFNLGADLATPVKHRFQGMIIVDEIEVKKLEDTMDYCQGFLTPLREFVLPGGSLLNANLHVARTVCRRAERLIVQLKQVDEINPYAVPFVNRLSDLFFVLARYVQFLQEKPEVTWDKKKGLRYLAG
jgi:cob(I)alamin adenosyltransferase